MDDIIDILIADASEAEVISQAPTGQSSPWPCLRFPWADFSVLVHLLDVLSNDAFGDSLLSGDLILCCKSEGKGPWVIRIPDDVRDKLAALSGDPILGDEARFVAIRWAMPIEHSGKGPTLDDLEPFLRELAVHARAAVMREKLLLLHMSL